MKAEIVLGRWHNSRAILFICKYRNTKNRFLDINERPKSLTLFYPQKKGVEFTEDYIQTFKNEKYGTTFIRYFRSNLSGGGK